MVFGEFEREMTSQRTAINAYERSKRGLANGGVVPLGYRRDKTRKGYLIVDEEDAEIVREIFNTYLEEKSIKKAMAIIKAKYEGVNPKLKRIGRSRIYSILTNKAYIGIREIYKKDRNRAEEVKAVWNGIVDKKIFEDVQRLLQANRERFHSQKPTRFNYLLSGLIRCGKCGEKLQGKSAYSSTKKKHYYYSHKHTCKNGELNRIDAEATHRLVLDWLKDISTNGEKFHRLQEEGRIRIKKRIDFLNKSLRELDQEEIRLEKEIEARVSELVKTKLDAVKDTIEKSIVKLDQEKKEVEAKQLYIKHEIEALKELLADGKDLFREYSDVIKNALNNSFADLKGKLRDIISYIRIDNENIKIALSGVNRKALSSSVFVSAPGEKQKANPNLSLILDKIPLPPKLLLRNKSYLYSLYVKQGLPKREIARRLNVRHSTVIATLKKLGIHENSPNKGHGIQGQIPFGYDYKNGKLEKNEEEQKIIRVVKQLKSVGFSLRGIARELNKRLIPTKNNGIWHANTVRKILVRFNTYKVV